MATDKLILGRWLIPSGVVCRCLYGWLDHSKFGSRVKESLISLIRVFFCDAASLSLSEVHSGVYFSSGVYFPHCGDGAMGGVGALGDVGAKVSVGTALRASVKDSSRFAPLWRGEPSGDPCSEPRRDAGELTMVDTIGETTIGGVKPLCWTV